MTKNLSLRHQPTHKCDVHAKFEVSKLNCLAYSVWTIIKKRILAFFCARSAQFLNYEKIARYSINPHTIVTSMQNLRFLHWTVRRTACEQTWKNGFLACFLRAKHPIFKLRKNHFLQHQPTSKCDLHAKFEVSTLNGLAYSVRTNRKNGFWHVFCAQSAQFLKWMLSLCNIINGT